MLIDGMEFNTMHGVGGGAQRLYRANPQSTSEINLGLAAVPTTIMQVRFVRFTGQLEF